ncbi:MAG TPA: nucleotide-binding protein [Bradyrhizobium sp.]|nr:nucleotide-binding protein [Bradyrhizobium sp.]
MDVRFRVYVSVPTAENLTPSQTAILDGMLQKLEESKLRPRGYFKSGLTEDVPSPGGMPELMARCQGALVLGFARSQTSVTDNQIGAPPKTYQGWSPTEYAHVEGGIAMALDRPLLVVRESRVLDRGIVAGKARNVVLMPDDATPEWLNSSWFGGRYDRWLKDVNEHQHVFLGSCSEASRTADAIRHLLESHGITVLDWRKGFSHGQNILEQITRAATYTVCGIFLFTADDDRGAGSPKSPRDNVVFEAGYFSGRKGKRRTLIILEKGVKPPADLGGDVYVPLPDRNDVSTIEEELLRALGRIL